MASERLALVELDDFNWIPRRFFEDSDDPFMTDAVVENLYTYSGQILENPAEVLYGFIDLDDAEGYIWGMLWLQVEPLSRSLVVKYLAVDSQYRSITTLKRIMEFLKIRAKELNLEKILTTSTKPRAVNRYFQGYVSQVRIVVKEV